jgi:hypothetical protein
MGMTQEHSPKGSTLSDHADLFLISLLLLFLEMACIRWFPAHVLFLTFFTNTVLLACFLGMSVGCLGARAPRTILTTTPALLAIALGAAHAVEGLSNMVGRQLVSVESRSSPQLVYFGAEPSQLNLARLAFPVEAVAGFFFLFPGDRADPDRTGAGAGPLAGPRSPPAPGVHDQHPGEPGRHRPVRALLSRAARAGLLVHADRGLDRLLPGA